MSPYKLTNPQINPSKKVVEVIIGGGAMSLPRHSAQADTQYLCIDPVYGDNSDDPLIRDYARGIADEVTALELFACSGIQTTLPAGSVDRVVMTDVLNSFETEGFSNRSPLAEGLLQEAKRILRIRGKVNVGTDNHSHLSAAQILQLGKSIGFKCRIVFGGTRVSPSDAKLFQDLMYKQIDTDGTLEKYLIEMEKLEK